MGIWKTMAYKTVEDKIKTNFESKNMITPLKIQKKNKKGTIISNKKEIVTLDEINNLDYCLNMIENVVKTTTLPQELEYIDKIKELKCNHKYEILEIKYNMLGIWKTLTFMEVEKRIEANFKSLNLRI